MKYLNDNDLKSKVFQIFITESSADFPEVINYIEEQNIELIKSYLNGRYDVALIFSSGIGDMEVEVDFTIDEYGRHPLILKVLICLVAYDLIRRNAARKVPDDYKDDYKWAMKWLKGVKDNKEHPDGLPPKTDEEGNLLQFAKWGNNKNEDFYL